MKKLEEDFNRRDDPIPDSIWVNQVKVQENKKPVEHMDIESQKVKPVEHQMDIESEK